MLISNDIHTEIPRVFMDPARTYPDNRRPFLYLLRRDLTTLYGPEDSVPDLSKLKAPLLTALGVMIGLELLAKLRIGKHEATFEDLESFMRDICKLPVDQATALAQFRHAVAHGYRLGATRRKDQQRYSFALSDVISAASPITEIKPLEFTVNLWALKKLFVAAIKGYRAILEADFDLQKKFTVCLANLGECQIGRNTARLS